MARDTLNSLLQTHRFPFPSIPFPLSLGHSFLTTGLQCSLKDASGKAPHRVYCLILRFWAARRWLVFDFSDVNIFVIFFNYDDRWWSSIMMMMPKGKLKKSKFFILFLKAFFQFRIWTSLSVGRRSEMNGLMILKFEIENENVSENSIWYEPNLFFRI